MSSRLFTVHAQHSDPDERLGQPIASKLDEFMASSTGPEMLAGMRIDAPKASQVALVQ